MGRYCTASSSRWACARPEASLPHASFTRSRSPSSANTFAYRGGRGRGGGGKGREGKVVRACGGWCWIVKSVSLLFKREGSASKREKIDVVIQRWEAQRHTAPTRIHPRTGFHVLLYLRSMCASLRRETEQARWGGRGTGNRSRRCKVGTMGTPQDKEKKRSEETQYEEGGEEK